MGAQFKDSELLRLDPRSLKYAPWNPSRRIDATDKAFLTLMDSIREHGQFLPVLINEHGLVIEGNRRVAACGLLGVPVECVVKSLVDPFTIYEVVNRVRLPITGIQIAEIYSKEQRAVSFKQRNKMEQLVAVFGSIEELMGFLDSDNPKENMGTAEGISRLVRNWPKSGVTRAQLGDGPRVVKWLRTHNVQPYVLRYLRYWPDFLKRANIDGDKGRQSRYFNWVASFVYNNKPLPVRLTTAGTYTYTERLIAVWVLEEGNSKDVKLLLPRLKEASKETGCQLTDLIDQIVKKKEAK
jgi:hypothetical protein